MEFGDTNDKIYFPNKIASPDLIMKCSVPVQWSVLKYNIHVRRSVEETKFYIAFYFGLDII